MTIKPLKYKEMERYMTYALCGDAAIFVLYLLFAGLGIVWLKVVFAIIALILSGLMLGYLYMTQELLKRRSFLITTGAAAIAICVLFSLILNFPSPNKYKPAEEKETAANVCVQQL